MNLDTCIMKFCSFMLENSLILEISEHMFKSTSDNIADICEDR